MAGRQWYIIAGEASGDLYGARLIESLNRQDPQIKFYGFGGQKMEAAGCKLSRRIEQLEMIGFVEVAKKLPMVLSNFRVAKKDLLRLRPDALILIDYPGFNLRMAEWASKIGIKVFYYIAPQTWAWKEKRVRLMQQYIDHLFVILPFEYNYFKEKGILNVHFYGHPLFQEVGQHMADGDFRKRHHLEGKKLVAVLPGSRKNELGFFLPVLRELILSMPELHFVIAAMQKLDNSMYAPMEDLPNATLIPGQTYDILRQCDAGLIKSGTSTLEAALFDLPQVVFYKLSPLSAKLIRWFIRIPFVALPNLIMGKKIVPELLQKDCTPQNLMLHLRQILSDDTRNEMRSAYHELRNLLHHDQNVSDLIAARMIGCLDDKD